METAGVKSLVCLTYHERSDGLVSRMPIDGGVRFSATRVSPDRRAPTVPIACERLAEHVTDDHRSLVVPWPVGNRNIGPGEFSLVFEVGAPIFPECEDAWRAAARLFRRDGRLVAAGSPRGSSAVR